MGETMVGSSPPNLSMKHCSAAEILSNFQNVKSSAQMQNPIEDFLTTVLVSTSHPFMRRFRCVRFLAVWKSSKHVNREPSSCNHLGAFHLMCFARVYEIFTAVVSESQRGPHVVF